MSEDHHTIGRYTLYRAAALCFYPCLYPSPFSSLTCPVLELQGRRLAADYNPLLDAGSDADNRRHLAAVRAAIAQAVERSSPLPRTA